MAKFQKNFIITYIEIYERIKNVPENIPDDNRFKLRDWILTLKHGADTEFSLVPPSKCLHIRENKPHKKCKRPLQRDDGTALYVANRDTKEIGFLVGCPYHRIEIPIKSHKKKKYPKFHLSDIEHTLTFLVNSVDKLSIDLKSMQQHGISFQFPKSFSSSSSSSSISSSSSSSSSLSSSSSASSPVGMQTKPERVREEEIEQKTKKSKRIEPEEELVTEELLRLQNDEKTEEKMFEEAHQLRMQWEKQAIEKEKITNKLTDAMITAPQETKNNLERELKTVREETNEIKNEIKRSRNDEENISQNVKRTKEHIVQIAQTKAKRKPLSSEDTITELKNQIDTQTSDTQSRGRTIANHEIIINKLKNTEESRDRIINQLKTTNLLLKLVKRIIKDTLDRKSSLASLLNEKDVKDTNREEEINKLIEKNDIEESTLKSQQADLEDHQVKLSTLQKSLSPLETL